MHLVKFSQWDIWGHSWCKSHLFIGQGANQSIHSVESSGGVREGGSRIQTAVGCSELRIFAPEMARESCSDVNQRPLTWSSWILGLKPGSGEGNLRSWKGRGAWDGHVADWGRGAGEPSGVAGQGTDLKCGSEGPWDKQGSDNGSHKLGGREIITKHTRSASLMEPLPVSISCYPLRTPPGSQGTS